MNGHAIRELAKAWATVAHDGQCRKGAGEPYINHAERVSDSVWGWRRKSIAWLHDVIEDAGHNEYDIAGKERMEDALRTIFPQDIINDVMALSRIRGHDGQKKSYQGWIEDIASSGNQDVIAVKLADIEDNLHDITDIPDMQSTQVKYMRAKATLLEVAK